MGANVYRVDVSDRRKISLFVKASCEDEAVDHITDLYKTCEIELDAENIVEGSDEVCVEREYADGEIPDEWIDYDLTKTDKED